MLIPIGTRPTGRAPALGDDCLLVANVLVSCLTNQLVQQQATETRQRLQGCRPLRRRASVPPPAAEIQRAARPFPPRATWIRTPWPGAGQARRHVEEFKSRQAPASSERTATSRPGRVCWRCSPLCSCTAVDALLSNVLFSGSPGPASKTAGPLFYIALYVASGAVAASSTRAMNPQASFRWSGPREPSPA